VRYHESGQLKQAQIDTDIFKFADQAYYIIYEYCANREIFDYAASLVTHLDNELCHLIFVQALQGVAYMHSRNVCHYDLKLENLMFDDTFSVKIIDFGLSGGNRVKAVDTKGTIGYIAPEFLKPKDLNEKLKGEKVDVFALGVILFALYFGFIPF